MSNQNGNIDPMGREPIKEKSRMEMSSMTARESEDGVLHLYADHFRLSSVIFKGITKEHLCLHRTGVEECGEVMIMGIRTPIEKSNIVVDWKEDDQ